MTADEIFAQLINERGYVIVCSKEPLRVGMGIAGLVSHLLEKFEHPFTIIKETDVSDYLQQREVMQRLIGKRTPWREEYSHYHYYRTVTD